MDVVGRADGGDDDRRMDPDGDGNGAEVCCCCCAALARVNGMDGVRGASKVGGWEGMFSHSDMAAIAVWDREIRKTMGNRSSTSLTKPVSIRTIAPWLR